MNPLLNTLFPQVKRFVCTDAGSDEVNFMYMKNDDGVMDRIEESLQKLDKDLRWLCKKIGIASDNYSQNKTHWRNRGFPKKHYQSAAKALGVNIDWLVNGRIQDYASKSDHDNFVMEQKYDINAKRESIALTVVGAGEAPIEPAKMLPVLTKDQATNWREALANFNPEKDDGMLKISDIPTTKNSFVFIVQSDSMAPKISEGSHVLIDPDIDAQIGYFVLVEISGDVVIRQLWMEAGDMLLRPLNDKYPIKPVSGSAIIGVVTWVIPKAIPMIY